MAKRDHLIQTGMLQNQPKDTEVPVNKKKKKWVKNDPEEKLMQEV